MSFMYQTLIGSMVYCLFSSVALCKEVNALLEITKGQAPMSQQMIKVNKNDVVHLVISSDEPGDLHLHAYHLSVHVDSKIKSVLDFKAFATGRFPFEWHSEVKPSAAPKAHHKALAIIDVFPN